MSNNPTGIVMRDSTLSATLEQDIERPSFYDDIGEYVGLEFTQGQFFIERAHYSYDDQFVCMLEGSASLRLVPHIDWNQMYPGEQISTRKGRQSFVTPLATNESPVNLFHIDFDKYPKTQYVEQKYQETLAPGDCIFIPAFYFY